MVCQGWRTALAGLGKSCELVTGPGNEAVSVPGPLDLQSCHLLGSLASILHLPGPALLPAGPTATPTAVPLHLEPGGSVGTHSWVPPGLLRKSCSLEVFLRQAKPGCDGYRKAWEGMDRMTPHWNSTENSQPHPTGHS